MAIGYTRIGKMLIPYEKPDPVKPAKKAKKVEPVAPIPDPEPACPMPEPAPQKSFLESAVEAVEEVVKPKRRGRPKKNDAGS